MCDNKKFFLLAMTNFLCNECEFKFDKDKQGVKSAFSLYLASKSLRLFRTSLPSKIAATSRTMGV